MEVENIDNTINNEIVLDLLKRKEFNILVQKCKMNRLSANYDNLKYGKEYYSLGQQIQLSHEGQRKEKMYGIIEEICGLTLLDNNVPMIRTQILYSKSSLKNTKQKEILDGISQFELFPTPLYQWYFCTSIDHQITILTLKDYEERASQNEKTYFSRAKYDPGKDKFDPPARDWGKICKCQQVSNPDKAYIFCEKCTKWFHQECLGLTPKDCEKIDKFYCDLCKKTLKKKK